MKKVLTYLVLFLFIMHSFDAVIIYFHFKWNQDYIAEVLCINKDKPELKCNGCCQLKANILENEKQKKDHQKTADIRKPVLMMQAVQEIVPSPENRIVTRSVARSINPEKQFFLTDVFHPPGV